MMQPVAEPRVDRELMKPHHGGRDTGFDLRRQTRHDATPGINIATDPGTRASDKVPPILNGTHSRQSKMLVE